MFRPVPMSRVGVLVRSNQAADLTRVLADAAAVQIETPPAEAGLAPGVERTLITRAESLVREIEQLARDMEIAVPPAGNALAEGVDPERDIPEMELRVGDFVADVDEVRHELTIIRDEQATILERIEVLLMLGPLTWPLEELRALQHVSVHIGILRDVNIRRVEASLGQLPHSILRLPGPATGWDLVLIFAAAKSRDLVAPVLASANFKPLELPADLNGLPTDATTGLWKRMEDLEDERKAAAIRMRELVSADSAEIVELARTARAARVILEAEQSFGRTKSLTYVSGWVPTDVAPGLKDTIERTIGPANYVASRAADPSDETAPVLLRNPGFFKPFETIVTTYGLPNPREIDPTPIVAVTYLLMFGAMFGDIGQGLLVALAGFWVSRKGGEIGPIGKIVGMCGIMAIIFGFIYGSIFGIEMEILPHWLSLPLVKEHAEVEMGNLVILGSVALALGIGLLSLGIIFNIMNSVREKDYIKAFLDPNGLVALTFYWSALAWVALAALGIETIVAKVLVGVLGIALLVIISREPIARAIEKKHEIFEGGFGFFAIEAVIELMDTCTRFLSNTLSFIRIAAFGLTHAAIFMAVHVIGVMVAGQASGFGYVMAFIIGNIFVMVLEVLIVSIQCLRLQYYEIFGKFFRGGGIAFRPFVARG